MATKINAMTIPDMPNGDFEALTWLQSFATNVALDPAAAGATPEQSDRIVALVKGFDDALGVANCDFTRTKPTIERKNLARNEAVKAVRELVNAIKANPAIDDVQRCNLGLRMRRDQRRRQDAAPARPPLLQRRSVRPILSAAP